MKLPTDNNPKKSSPCAQEREYNDSSAKAQHGFFCRRHPRPRHSGRAPSYIATAWGLLPFLLQQRHRDKKEQAAPLIYN
jgi:hypothetical protein